MVYYTKNKGVVSCSNDLTYTQEMSCIELSRDRDYADWGYSCFTSVPPDRILPALPRVAMPYIISCNPVIWSYAVWVTETANLAQETHIDKSVTSSQSWNEPSRLQKADPDAFSLTSHDTHHDTQRRAFAERFSVFCPSSETEHPPVVTTCRLKRNL